MNRKWEVFSVHVKYFTNCFVTLELDHSVSDCFYQRKQNYLNK